MNAVVRTFHPENRLAKAISFAGGVTMAEALKRAEANVQVVRADCMAALDQKIAQIETLTSAAAFSSADADIRAVYALSNEILNEAGVFGLSELSEAGRSLCELTGAWRAGAPPLDLRAIAVHVAAMKSLRRPDVAADPAVRTAVLEGLRQVTAKIAKS